MRPLQCLIGRHTWAGWQKYENGCGEHGCDHYLRHCTRCPRWQHQLLGGRPRKFKWGGLFPKEPTP